MKMKLPKLDIRKYARRDVVIAVAALALIAGVVTGRERPTVELIEPKAAAPAVNDDIDLSRLQRPESTKPTSDPFAQKSFAPAQQQQAGTTQETKPSVPPLPFKYLGKAIEDGKLEVFLARGEDSYSVRAGQKIDDYRVDKVTEKTITFTYLPMKTKQTLDIPEVQ